MILSITIHVLIVRQLYSYTGLQCHISYNYKTFNVIMTAILYGGPLAITGLIYTSIAPTSSVPSTCEIISN